MNEINADIVRGKKKHPHTKIQIFIPVSGVSSGLAGDITAETDKNYNKLNLLLTS